MRLLGAILAGGSSRRFGSDKAMAVWRGKRLIDWVAEALDAQCESVALCGRDEAGFVCLSDTPETGLGPLAGLNAALRYAEANGFTHVLSAGVDAPNLPHSLASELAGEGAAIVEDQPVVGLWPSASFEALAGFMKEGGRSLYGFAERVEARRMTLEQPLMNVNRLRDLGEDD